ncbi:YceI family protein [Haliscomenobacter hydrossis]|uniref:YceI family protein n=1 Tax=Haliscomenobacter hydrossis (strain ATCC 27775 / DSM 1100 / LMG 10767 / O) TaxID=760192 RepID=F4L6Y4_HALH1|nr:YceI family protein [Haliscomenobacter hydrossis]AEE51939.1 YceI family protein [Haliscomenobacter hydrossis DSM 1100]
MAKFQIQQTSSTVNWTGKKVLGLHTGRINIANGYIEIKDNNISGGEIQIDMTSIVITDIVDKKTNHDFLEHLLNDDFFSVDKFKTSKLIITGSNKIEINKFKIDGNLIIKDISHPVSFIATVEVFTNTLHSLGEIVIDRTIYNIRYGSGKFIDNLGDKLIYDDFVLQFKLVGQA